MYSKRSNPHRNGDRRDKVALRTTCIKRAKSKSIKIRTGCQYVGYFCYSDNLNWTAQNLRLGRGLDIAAIDDLLLQKLELGMNVLLLQRLEPKQNRVFS